MPTLKQETLFFNDEFGRTRPGAKMYFYEAGTTTQKATYTDVDLTSPNAWPLVADGAGVFPQTFLATGGYRIVYKDQNDVQFDERDDINVAETTILSTSDFYFSNLVDAKLGVSISGLTVNLQIGQIVRTAGKVTATDGLGGEWIVVAGGTGTADDDLYADLDNGLQIQKLFNQLYTTRNFAEIALAGASAQTTARTNIGAQTVPTAVTGFVAAESIYTRTVPSGQLDVGATIAQGVAGTIGPTGSGADLVWSAMDVIPLTATAIHVQCYIQVTKTAGTPIQCFIQLNGADVVHNDLATSAGGHTVLAGAGFGKSYLDSANLFQTKYDGSTGTYSVLFRLIGFEA